MRRHALDQIDIDITQRRKHELAIAPAVGQGDDEERLSLRSIEYAIGERLRQSVRCKARREVLRNLRARQSAEGHIDAPPFDAQVSMNAENRVGASRDLRLSIGGKDEE